MTSPSAPSSLRRSVASSASLLPLARQHFGVSAFRRLQSEAIDANNHGLDSLVIMPTGGGKSLCYQLPAIACARGLTLVVSPLIALMKDQVDGISSLLSPVTCSPLSRSAAFLNSDQNYHEQRDVLRMAKEGRLRLLYVSPERCMSPEFITDLVKCDLRAIVIDEAHCIASWGHDFRPSYAALGDLRKVFPGVAVHAFTATATDRVRQQIIESLSLRVSPVTCSPDPLLSAAGGGPILIGAFDRPNLSLWVLPRDADYFSRDEQLHHTLAMLDARFPIGGCDGIIYCNTRAETERLAALLSAALSEPQARACGHPVDVRPYHAGLEPDQRRAVQDWFMCSTAAPGCDPFVAPSLRRSVAAPKIVVATIAFGMGIDKPDVRFVIHYGMPSSLEVYHQEIGRAGRDGLPAECVMLYDRGDYHRWLELFDAPPHLSPVSCSPFSAEGGDGRLDALSDMECFCGVTMRDTKFGPCRHAHLVEYFGQEYVPPPSVAQSPSAVGCNACDHCLREGEAPAEPRLARRKPRRPPAPTAYGLQPEASLTPATVNVAGPEPLSF